MKFKKPTFSEESLQRILNDPSLDYHAVHWLWKMLRENPQQNSASRIDGVVIHVMNRSDNGDISVFKYGIVGEARGIQKTLEENYG